MLGDSSGKTNSFKDCLRKSVPNVLEDGEAAAYTSEEDSFSLCFPKHRTRKLQKMRLGKTRKNIFSEVGTDELSEEARRRAEETQPFALEIEPRDSDPLAPNVTQQKPSDSPSEERCQAPVQPPDSGWSQLALSGLTATQPGENPPLPISSCNQSSSEKDFTDMKKEGIGSFTSENSLPPISSFPEPEKMFSEKTLGGEEHGQGLEIQEDRIAGEQAESGTGQAACLFQSIGKSVFQMREPLDQSLGTVFSESAASSACTEEPRASAGGRGLCAVCCSEREDSLCSGSVDTGSWPTPLTNTSAAVKNSGLISTLKSKRRRFIYSVSDGASHQGKAVQAGRQAELTTPSAPFEASALEAPFTFTNADSGTPLFF